MTVDSTNNRTDYDPDGLVTTFAYDFRVDSASDMVVYADGVLYEGSYTVTELSNPLGGDVIFDAAPSAAIEVLTLIREVPITQETAYPPLGPFPAPSHERALDRLTFMVQQQQEQLGRAGVAPIDADPTTDYTLPKYAAGQYWLWDATSNKVITVSPPQGPPSDNPIFNALDWGAKIDGVTDDAEALNEALEYIDGIGGGILLVPFVSGLCKLGAQLRMGANTTLLSPPNLRYFKTHDASFLNNGYGYTTASNIPAYGGNGNITIIGGIWDGWAGLVDDQFSHFAIGYATNVTISNVTFLDNIDAHMIDMASCDNVLIDRCTFKGQKIVSKSPFTFDMLQLDPNTASPVASFPYFGIPTAGHNKNITIHKCSFGPNPDSADPAFNHAYVGVGSHSAVYNEWLENIRIVDCTFDNLEYAGVYNWKWNNADIEKCTFTGGDTGIRHLAPGAGFESSKDRAGVQSNQAQAGKVSNIRYCTFTGQTQNALSTSAIVHGTDLTIKYEDLKIEGLSVYDMTGGISFEIRDCKRSMISKCSFSNIVRSIDIQDACEDIKISDISIKDATSTFAGLYILGDSFDIDISDAHFTDLAGPGIRVADATNVSITNVTGKSLASALVYLDSSDNIVVDLDTVTLSPRAVRCVNECKNVDINVKLANAISGDAAISIDNSNFINISFGVLKNLDDRAILITGDSNYGNITGGTIIDHGLINDFGGVVIQSSSDNWYVSDITGSQIISTAVSPVVSVSSTCLSVAVSGVFTNTSNPVISNQSLGSSLSTNIPVLGSPEGVIYSPLGSSANDLNNGKLYIKEAGASGNTGWVVK